MHHKSYNPEKKSKICTLTKWPTQEELILVSVAWSNKKRFHPPCMGCWSIAGYSPHSNQHFVRFCLQFTRSHLDSWVDSSIVRVVSCQRAQHNHAPCLFSNADLLTWLSYLSVTASLKYAGDGRHHWQRVAIKFGVSSTRDLEKRKI